MLFSTRKSPAQHQNLLVLGQPGFSLPELLVLLVALGTMPAWPPKFSAENLGGRAIQKPKKAYFQTDKATLINAKRFNA